LDLQKTESEKLKKPKTTPKSCCRPEYRAKGKQQITAMIKILCPHRKKQPIGTFNRPTRKTCGDILVGAS
jgi:hypothetical protein